MITTSTDPYALLRKLRALNESFLKHMVRLEKRVVALEQQLAPGEEEALAAGKVRILVVDDEPLVWEVLEYLSDDHGYELVFAADGEAALRTFDQQFFQIVITDKNLPGMSGLDVLRLVKVRRPETSVVLITGYSTEKAAIAAVNHGASAYLTKPFEDIDMVAALVKELVLEQRTRVERRAFEGVFMERNRDFVSAYRAIQQQLDDCLKSKG